jgi:hypothetical protein
MATSKESQIMLHLNAIQVAQVERIVTLVDECFFESVKSNPLHQQTDGNVEFVVSLGNTMERAKGTSKVETTVVVYASTIEKDKARHFFASLDEALETVEGWHKELFGSNEEGVRVFQEKPHLTIVK